MHILVCAKQVPDTDQITIDPIRHTLNREGVPSILNPYDAEALELALRLKERNTGSVTVLSMGPAQAKAMLEKCLTLGTDSAWLITGREFSGSDTLATGYALARAVRHLETQLGHPFDLILCGKQAIDGDTAQTPPILAELLDLPQITNVREIALEENTISVTRQTTRCEQTLLCALPALVTVSATPWPLRVPTLRGKLDAKKKPLAILDAAALGLDPECCGLRGSPTRVVSTSVRTASAPCEMLEDTHSLARMLKELAGLKGGASHV